MVTWMLTMQRSSLFLLNAQKLIIFKYHNVLHLLTYIYLQHVKHT